ncbi:MAG: GNAT family N-acetyltransferase [Acidimicrobiia bacterium]|nr:MAG: GNAT family N-acetyltransferase [Acidimicrobiia bacterium]
MVERSSVVSLRIIDDENVRAVVDLSVSQEQKAFVASNVFSLAQAFATSNVWVRAVYADETAAGFVMLADDPDTERYYLWRFMIDERYQHMGFGRAAMSLMHEYVASRPGGTKVSLSFVPGDAGPGPFYKSLGYVETGEVKDGEVEAVLDLTQ